jgi:hypothetical protein
MSAGSVLARIVLDNPTGYHCGFSDPVTGHVSLTYRPPISSNSQSSNRPAQELFGPLKIFLIFGGRAKTKIHKSNGNTSSTHRGRAPLFAQHHNIYDGRHTSKAGECVRFPFSLNFPAVTQSLPGLDDFREDARFQEEAGHPLPPTFDASNRGFSKSFKAFVEYRLNAEIRMPGIDIQVLGLNHGDNEGIPILYEQPGLPPSSISNSPSRSFADSISLQNEHLLPSDQRPTGFRQKAKFALSSDKYPTYLFFIRGTIPSSACVGPPLTLELGLHPDQNRCTAPVPPEVTLRWVRAELRQHITVRAEHGFFSSEESSKDSCLPLPCRIVEPQVPFGKANDHTKLVHTSALDAASSFSTWNICQRYTLEIKYQIHAAGKEKTMKHTLPIVVHPPVVDGAGAAGYAEASSSSSAAAVGPPSALDSLPRDLESALPPSAPLDPATGLPEYERPPEYDQVLDMTTENDAAAESSSHGVKGKAAAVVAS